MKQHKKAVEEAAKEETNELLHCVQAVLTHDTRMADICDIYRMIGADGLSALLHVCGGKTVIFPTLEAFEDALIFSMCFYYHEVMFMTWEEITRLVPFKFSSGSMSHRIRKLSRVLREELLNMFGSAEDTDGK